MGKVFKIIGQKYGKPLNVNNLRWDKKKLNIKYVYIIRINKKC